MSEGSEGSEGGQSQDTITREKRLTGPGGRVTYQKQRTSQDVRESRIQEAANEEFKEEFEKDVRSLSQGINYIQFMLAYFRSYFQTMIDCKVWGEEMKTSKDVMGHVVSCQYFLRSDIKEE